MDMSVIGLIVATVLFIWYWKREKKRNDGLKEIPGPKPSPIVGNILQLGTQITTQYGKWSEEFGNIYKFYLASTEVVVISDAKWAKEIFSGDHIYTGKPALKEFAMFPDEPKNGMFTSEGEPWEVNRRFLLRQLRDFGFGKSSMESLIMDEVIEVLETYKKKEGTPVNKVRDTLRLAVVNSLWTILSSKRFKHDDPELLRLALSITETFARVTKEGGMLFFIPWLRYVMPTWSGFMGVREMLSENKAFFQKAINEHKENLDENDVKDYIDAYLLEVKKTTDPSSPFYGEKAERFLTAELFDLFIAGSDSTSITISWAVLYLCKFPDIQKKLHEEIGRVVGNSRRVSVSDRSNMPYTQALIDEVLRMSTLLPEGVQHVALAERGFKGYRIPKGAWIQLNLYHIHHNPATWGDPENFRPERFLSPDGSKYVKSENILPFQIGKRSCVGEPLARDTLFLYISNIFQQFSIAFDPNSESTSLEGQPGFMRQPFDYSVIMKSR